MFLKPGEPEDHALLAQPGHHEQDALQMSIVTHDHVDNLVNRSHFIRGAIHIIDWNWLSEFAGW